MRPFTPPLVSGVHGGDPSAITRDDARPSSIYLYSLRSGVIHPLPPHVTHARRAESHERTRFTSLPRAI
jgi:hypothetical protein